MRAARVSVHPGRPVCSDRGGTRRWSPGHRPRPRPHGIADAVASGVDGVEHALFFTADGIGVDWTVVDAMAAAGTFIGATEAWLPDGPMLDPHLAERLTERSENFARMHQHGVRLVCCSDAGAGPRKPHGVLPDGVVHFGAIGLTNIDAALAAATSVAAAGCGVADRKGTITAGYDADLIAVAGNPLHHLALSSMSGPSSEPADS